MKTTSDPVIEQLFFEWLKIAGDANAAAVLTAAQLNADTAHNESVSKHSEYLTVAEAHTEFNISKRALYRMPHLHRRRGRSIRILRSDLENVLRRDRLAA